MAPSQPPIRVALVGLSSRAATGWASSAHLPYLQSAAGRARFQVVALCNSSAAAAADAARTYGLDPARVRAYGSPEDLAADPDVQLVVVSTRVDKHFHAALAAARGAKDVFVEWPLADSLEHARELARVAREAGVRSVVGLQGWFTPAVRKFKELVESEVVGKILSSEVSASGGLIDREVLPHSLKYFTDRNVGGNIFHIGFMHLFDAVQFALGADVQDAHAHLQIQRPSVRVRDPGTGAIVETVTSDVPDLIYVTGTLAATAHTARTPGGPTLHVRFRRGQASASLRPEGTEEAEPALVWTVTGERGELRLVSHSGPALQTRGSGDIALSIHDYATGAVRPIEWAWPETLADLPLNARNVAALYEAYADGNATPYPDFEHAVRRHEQLEGYWAQFDEKVKSKSG